MNSADVIVKVLVMAVKNELKLMNFDCPYNNRQYHADSINQSIHTAKQAAVRLGVSFDSIKVGKVEHTDYSLPWHRWMPVGVDND